MDSMETKRLAIMTFLAHPCAHVQKCFAEWNERNVAKKLENELTGCWSHDQNLYASRARWRLNSWLRCQGWTCSKIRRYSLQMLFEQSSPHLLRKTGQTTAPLNLKSIYVNKILNASICASIFCILATLDLMIPCDNRYSGNTSLQRAHRSSSCCKTPSPFSSRAFAKTGHQQNQNLERKQNQNIMERIILNNVEFPIWNNVEFSSE